MERLTKKELLTLLEFIKERYSIRDVEIFKQRVLSRLAEIIQSNIRRYNELGPPPARKNRTNGTQRRCSASAADPLICDIQKNPPYNHHRNKPEVAHEHSSRSGLSGKFHRTLGVSHRTAVRSATESKPNHGTSHLTKHNELLLDRLTHHPLHGGRNARATTRRQQKFKVLEHVLNTLSLGLVVLTVNRKIRLATPFAIDQMRNYFGREAMDTNHLPKALRSWVEQQQRALRQKDDVAPPENPLVVEHDEKYLTIRFILGSDQNLLLLQEQLAATKCGSTMSCGLSPRESQVLQWLSQGKTNKEIGVILKLSARTVQKHLEHIYQKMGVESRTGAAAKAYEIVFMASKRPYHNSIAAPDSRLCPAQHLL